MREPLTIREMTENDRGIWLEMYAALFPGVSALGMNLEISRVLNSNKRAGFYAQRDGTVQGFAEYNIRDFANGCISKPVPFLEGIWVAPAARGQGIAKALVAHLENIARAQGYSEFGSNVEIDNHASLNMHEKLGFKETERVVYFRKEI